MVLQARKLKSPPFTIAPGMVSPATMTNIYYMYTQVTMERAISPELMTTDLLRATMKSWPMSSCTDKQHRHMFAYCTVH